MRRLFLILLGAAAVVLVFLANQIPPFQAAAPWIRAHVPGLQQDQSDAAAQTRSGGGQGRGSRQGGRQRDDGPTPVIVAEASYADVPVTADALGTIQALNTVTVRAQVDGRLVELAFKDGQDVHQGDILARIDPSTYQALYDQTLAKKAQDEAMLANARLDLDRYNKLAQSNFGSHQQADTQRATVAQFEAQIRSDQAAIDNTKAILDYTVIRSPLEGRTGIRAIDQGNIVHANDPSGIVTITQIKPISVLFSLPQQLLRSINAAMAKQRLTIVALDSDNKTVLDRGALDVIDNQVDQATGTVRLRGSFPNADLQLWPGQFVNVRLTIDTLQHVVVVPTSAVQRGPNGAFVFALNDDEATVSQLPVKVGQQTETQAVIQEGLTPPVKVVTTGFARLVDGGQVTATGSSPAPADTSGAGEKAPRQNRQRRNQSAGSSQQNSIP